ncbi:MAG: bifunctional riboflavin kinase/FAD synthetase [Rhizobiaceae bacterium]
MKQIQRIDDPKFLPPSLAGGVVAIGNFDGVHRGHRAVLDKALEIAEATRRPALVLTFEPHPRSVFQPDTPVFRLTPAPLKAELLGALGFDGVVEQQFSKEFSSHTADEFIQSILIDGLKASHVVTGFDFHFGKGRQGGPAYLMAASNTHGFDVTLVDAFRDEGAQVVSSSRIRDRLSDGDVSEAAGLLGYRYIVSAPVIKGKQLGRTLGFPTANMMLPDENRLAHGIYAVRFKTEAGSIHDAVASFGRRPTVDSNGEPWLETFLFDFDADLYGQLCEVSFFGHLRGEVKFDGLDPLMVQMRQDEAEAGALLGGVVPLSDLDAAMNFA